MERLERQRRQEEAERQKKTDEAAAAAVLEQEGQQEGAAAMQTDQQQQQQQQQAAAAAAEASPGGSGTAQPLAAEAAGGDASASPAQQQPQPPSSQQAAEGAAPAEAAASPPAAAPAAAGEDKAGPSSAPAAAAAAAAADAAAAAAGTSAAGASGSGGGSEEEAADKRRAAEEDALHRRYQAAFEALPLPLLRSLPRLLAEDWLGDRPASVLKMVVQVGWQHLPGWLSCGCASRRFRLAGSLAAGLGQHGNPAPPKPAHAHCFPAPPASLPASLPQSTALQGLNVVRPSFFPISLAELAASLLRLAARAAEGLAALAEMDPHSSSVLTTGVARYGKLMLVSVATAVWRQAP